MKARQPKTSVTADIAGQRGHQPVNFSNWTRRHWILFLIALLIVAIILVLSAPERIQQDVPEEDRTNKPQPTAENIREWLDLKQRGIGLLENQESTESTPIFERLATELPSETLGLRNLTVSRLVGLSQIDSARDPAALAKASQAAESAASALLKAEPESAEALILAARIARARDHTELALERYQQAVELAPDNPSNQFELAELLRSSNGMEAKQEAVEHLQQAFAADSENLFLFVELASLQAETENPGLAETLQTGCPLLAPLAESVRQFARVDVSELCEQAQAGVRNGEWNNVLRNVRILANVLRPEDATQSDRRRVDRDPLEFIQFDFSPEFDTAASRLRPSAPAAIPITFTLQSITTGLGWLRAGETLTSCRLIDFDLDGTLDLAVLTSSRLLILRQEATETGWMLSAEIEIPDGAVGLLVADLDNDPPMPMSSRSEPTPDASRDANASPPTRPVFRPEQDADLDFVVYGTFGVRIYSNNLAAESGRRSLVAVDPQRITGADSSAVSGPPGTITAATIVDLDHDGDLDIVVCGPSIQVLANRGNLLFQVRPVPTKTPASFASIRDIVVVDWDRDVDLDLLLLTDRGLGLVENLRHGRLRYRDLAVEDLPATNLHCLSVADVDSNGSWDLLVGCSAGVALMRTDIPTVGVVQLRPAELISSEPASGLLLCDFDNDGWQDIVSWNGELLQVLRSLNGEEFTPFIDQALAAAATIRDCDFGDVDQDGDLDLAIATTSQIEQMVNKGGNANGWIDVAIRGQQVKGEQRSASGRVNHYGVGSLLELKAGPIYQQLRVDREVMHFGLGDQSHATLLRILWTNGIPHNVLAPDARELIYEKQTLKGSCPYLYTWNGESFDFCTDLLWAAPIGLQFADGQLAPTRPGEYLKIPGHFLQAIDGEYRLRITEELWEAAYFDQVELLAVDHPSEIEIFTNEKVGPPTLAEHRLHAVRKRLLPVSAKNHRSRDLLPELTTEDDIYAQPFDQKFRQGLTEEHYLEIDLGQHPVGSRLMLFLTGWIYPTDTSINVQLAQDPDRPGPRPPSLWTIDSNGQWKKSRDFMGFPGGKTKTIAVDLQDIFETDDCRLRIATSMELYWDAIFYTVNASTADVAEQPLPLLTAELRYRGVSRAIPHPGNGPERYDYASVETAPRWPAMGGSFTRYGNVAELLQRADDRMVIMAAGDEIALRFSAPEDDLPAGWTRDFVLHNVGYDKDADLNTVYGQTVEPLPSRDVPLYPDLLRAQQPQLTPEGDSYQSRLLDANQFWNAVRRQTYQDGDIRPRTSK